MSCTLATASLMAVCLSLPDLPEPAQVPDLPHWGMRQAFLSYKNDKTLVKREMEWHGFQARAALGNTRFYSFERNVLKSRKTIYFYAEKGDFGVMVMPREKQVAIRWEFD